MQAGTKALLVYPRFLGLSFWNFAETCNLLGARYPAPPLGLVTLAAMLPQSWDIRLVDCNVRALQDEDLAWADLVMIGGMLPQQYEALQIIARAKAAGKPVVMGGPDATSSPEIYADADFRVLGEVEGILGDFVAAWEGGARSGTFVAPKFQVDVTQTPVPRFDLLDFENYLFVGVQFSRGCPFTCEFCDIIELYGRAPRTKTTAQMLAELDRLYELGFRGHVDFVDDNLIGNKKAVKAFLPELIAWQKAHGYPFELSTEASLNLADDDELLALLSEAGFFTVFIGIESPDEEVLRSARKKQNIRRDMVASVEKIYGAGIVVIAGFIIGFDNESSRIGETMTQLIEEAAIPVSMVGLLYALPNTQLTRRLDAEGRLFASFATDDGVLADQCVAGLNFLTHRPRLDILKDYLYVVEKVYAPKAFFGRVERANRMMKRVEQEGASVNLSRVWQDAHRFVRFMALSTVRHPRLAARIWGLILRGLLTNPKGLPATVKMALLYAHLGPFSEFIRAEIGKQIEEIESGAWIAPETSRQVA